MDQPESTANTSRSMASAFTKGEVKNWANLKVKTKNKHPLTHSSKCSCKIKNNVALQWEVYHSQLKLEMPPTASSDDRRLMYINTHIKILKTICPLAQATVGSALGELLLFYICLKMV